MYEQQVAFLKALQANEDDTTTRLIYADWLDEHDMPEEAARQRQWPYSKQWLVEFAKKCGSTCVNYDTVTDAYYKRYQQWRREGEVRGEEPPDYPEPDEQWREITYQDVVQAGATYLSHEDYFTQKGSESARDQFTPDYWHHWAIVTGFQVPEKKRYNNPFSCSC